MSDDELDSSKAGRPAGAGHARGEPSRQASGGARGTGGTAPGRQILTESTPSGQGEHDVDESRAFLTRTVNAARAEMVKLAAAVAAIDYFPAQRSATVLRGQLRTARVRIERDLAHDAGSTRMFAELEQEANELLAKAEALRSPAAPRTPDASNQRAGAVHAPPDLGNYDSEVGKHVVVLRSWDDIALTTRRVELQGRLATTLDSQGRDKLLREYEALEWVARERNLALPKDPGEEAAPQAYAGGKPIKFWVPSTGQRMRAMLEREMAEGTGYEAAKDHAGARIGYGTLPRLGENNDKRLIGDQQMELMDHDAAGFRVAFQAEAKQTAISMLDASSVAVDTVLRSYGIAGGTFRLTEAARKVAAHPGSLDTEVETWVGLSQRRDGNHAASAAGPGNRERLAKEAQHLRDLQDSIDALAREQLRLMQMEQARHPQHPGMARPPKQPDLRKLESMAGNNPGSQRNPFDLQPKPAAAVPEQQLALVQGALQFRRAQFRTAWINAERAHPVLAAYRARKQPDVSTLAGIGSDEGTLRSVIKQVLPKLGNILRTKAALVGAWGTLDPLRLAPVVELTKRRMFVAEGSYRDRAVHDMAEQAHERDHGVAHWAFEAVMIGLTLLTLVPTGGASAGIALTLTGLAYDIYAGLDEHEDFKLLSAAGDTDLDKVRSLSDTEPSLTPLLMRMVSAGLNFTVAAGLFKRAVALRQMATNSVAEREALAALNKAGEELGVKGVGDEAVGEMRAYTHANSESSASNSSVSTGTAESTNGAGPSHLSQGTTRGGAVGQGGHSHAEDLNVNTTAKKELTAPTQRPDPNATPAGRPTKISPKQDDSTRRSLQRENEAAVTLQRSGYNVEQNPAVAGRKRPDLLINGQLFDVVSPTSTRATNVVDRIREKVESGQARRIVLALDDTDVLVSDIVAALKRTPISELEQIVMIRRGDVRTIWPTQGH